MIYTLVTRIDPTVGYKHQTLQIPYGLAKASTLPQLAGQALADRLLIHRLGRSVLLLLSEKGSVS